MGADPAGESSRGGGAERLKAQLPMVPRWAEGTVREGRSDKVKEVRQIWRGEAMNGYEGMLVEFELYSLLDQQPVEDIFSV